METNIASMVWAFENYHTGTTASCLQLGVIPTSMWTLGVPRCGTTRSAVLEANFWSSSVRAAMLGVTATAQEISSSQVFRGQKVFYLIKPTPENLKAYEAWICDAKQDSTFFPDTVGGSA